MFPLSHKQTNKQKNLYNFAPHPFNNSEPLFGDQEDWQNLLFTWIYTFNYWGYKLDSPGYIEKKNI